MVKINSSQGLTAAESLNIDYGIGERIDSGRTTVHSRTERAFRPEVVRTLEERMLMTLQSVNMNFLAFGIGPHKYGDAINIDGVDVAVTLQGANGFIVNKDGSIQAQDGGGIVVSFKQDQLVTKVVAKQTGNGTGLINFSEPTGNDYRPLPSTGGTIVANEVCNSVQIVQTSGTAKYVLTGLYTQKDVPDVPSDAPVSVPTTGPVLPMPKMESVTHTESLNFSFPGRAKDHTVFHLGDGVNAEIASADGWGLVIKEGALVTVSDGHTHDRPDSDPGAGDIMQMTFSPFLEGMSRIKIQSFKEFGPAQGLVYFETLKGPQYLPIPENGIIEWDGSTIISMAILPKRAQGYGLTGFDRVVTEQQPSILVHPPKVNPLDSKDLANGNDFLKARLWQYQQLATTLDFQLEAGSDPDGIAAMDALATQLTMLTSISADVQKQFANLSAAAVKKTKGLQPLITDAQLVDTALSALNKDWQQRMRIVKYRTGNIITDDGRILDQKNLNLSAGPGTLKTNGNSAVLVRSIPGLDGALTMQTLRGKVDGQPTIFNHDTTLSASGGQITTLDFTTLKGLVTNASFIVQSVNGETVTVKFMKGEQVLSTQKVVSGQQVSFSQADGMSGVIILHAPTGKSASGLTLSNISFQILPNYTPRDVVADMSIKNNGTVAKDSQPDWRAPANAQETARLTNSNIYFGQAGGDPHWDLMCYTSNNDGRYNRYDVISSQGDTHIDGLFYLTSEGTQQLSTMYYYILPSGKGVVVSPGAPKDLILDIKSSGYYHIVNTGGTMQKESVTPPTEFTLESNYIGTYTQPTDKPGFTTNKITTDTMKPQRVLIGSGLFVMDFIDRGQKAGAITAEVWTGYGSTNRKAELLATYKGNLSPNTVTHLQTNVRGSSAPSQRDEPILITVVITLPDGTIQENTVYLNRRPNEAMVNVRDADGTLHSVPRPLGSDEQARLDHLIPKILYAAQTGQSGYTAPSNLADLYKQLYNVTADPQTVGAVSGAPATVVPGKPVQPAAGVAYKAMENIGDKMDTAIDVTQVSLANLRRNVNNAEIGAFHYKIVTGDTLTAIAAKFKIPDWHTIYNDSWNADFRKLRPDPNKIQPGDVINIPMRMISNDLEIQNKILGMDTSLPPSAAFSQIVNAPFLSTTTCAQIVDTTLTEIKNTDDAREYLKLTPDAAIAKQVAISQKTVLEVLKGKMPEAVHKIFEKIFSDPIVNSTNLLINSIKDYKNGKPIDEVVKSFSIIITTVATYDLTNMEVLSSLKDIVKAVILDTGLRILHPNQIEISYSADKQFAIDTLVSKTNKLIDSTQDPRAVILTVALGEFVWRSTHIDGLSTASLGDQSVFLDAALDDKLKDAATKYNLVAIEQIYEAEIKYYDTLIAQKMLDPHKKSSMISQLNLFFAGILQFYNRERIMSV